MIKECVEYVVKSLVDEPSTVRVTCDQKDNQYNVVISVLQQDRGRVIGRNGETIRALRALISAIVPPLSEVKVEIAE